MSKSSYAQLHPNSNEGPSRESALMSSLDTISTVVMAAAKFTKKGAKMAGKTTVSIADAVGMKDTFEAAGKATYQATRKLAEKGRIDAQKQLNKAKRLATKALDFEEEEDSGDTADFDLLLSAAGAVKRSIPIHGHFSQIFAVPAGQKLVWKARVKRQDIGFMVKEIKDNEGMVDIEPLQKYSHRSQIQGQIEVSTVSRNITLTFDNSHSLQSKNVCYWVAIGENVSLSDDALGENRTRETAAADNGPSE